VGILKVTQLALFGTLPACISAVALAQANADSGSDSALAEIIVTAQKREESIREVPASIAVFSGAGLKEANINSTMDLQMATPSLSISHIDAQQFIFLRGLGSDLEGIGTEGSTSVNIDGVYVARPGSTLADFLDIERIEVARGPQGTLYGQNSVGGAINIVTVKPKKTFEADANVSFGNYAERRYEGELNIPIVADQLAARFAILKSQHEGYTQNVNLLNNDHLGGADNLGARVSLLYTPTSDLSVLLSADYDRDHGDITPYKAQSAGFAGDYGAVVSADPFKVNSNLPTFLHTDGGGSTLTVNWDLGAATLTSLSAYRRNNEAFLEDVDGTEIAGMEVHWRQHQSQLSEELRLSSTTGGLFDWMAGLYYFRENSAADVFLLFGPQSPVAGPPGSTYGLRFPSTAHTTVYAAFTQETLHLTKRLSLTAGLRYGYEQKSANVNDLEGETYDSVVPLGSTDDSRVWKSWTPNFILGYQPTPLTNLYAKASKGFKSGGFNALTLQQPFEPESIWSYEAGAKAEWLDGRMLASLAGFYYTLSNQQLNTYVSPVTIIRNAAESRGHGGELEVTARPMSRLDVSFGLAYLVATFQRFNTTNPNDPDLGVIDLAGNTLRNAPKWSSSVSSRYKFPLSDGATLSLGGSVEYRSRVFFDQFNDPAVAQNALTLLNARLGYTSASGHWDVSLFGNNLTDKAYRVASYRIDVTGGNVLSFMGPPRTWGVQIGAHF
jgi:iron complex outermembrane recepter protein